MRRLQLETSTLGTAGGGRAENIGDLIRRRRMELSMSQQALAAGICSTSTISRIEQNMQAPEHRLLRRIMERLDMPDETCWQYHTTEEYLTEQLKNRLLLAIRYEDLENSSEWIDVLRSLIERDDVIGHQFLALLGVMAMYREHERISPRCTIASLQCPEGEIREAAGRHAGGKHYMLAAADSNSMHRPGHIRWLKESDLAPERVSGENRRLREARAVRTAGTSRSGVQSVSLYYEYTMISHCEQGIRLTAPDFHVGSDVRRMALSRVEMELLNHLGLALLYAGRVLEATDIFTALVTRLRDGSLENPSIFRELSVAQNNLALCYAAHGKLAYAEKFIDEAMESGNHAGSITNAVRLLHTRTEIRRARGDMAGADEDAYAIRTNCSVLPQDDPGERVREVMSQSLGISVL